VRSPLELIGAHSWKRAVFTTYSLSLSVFESAVLDQLVRGGARNALILADVDKVPTGVFHAKVTALTIPLLIRRSSAES